MSPSREGCWEGSKSPPLADRASHPKGGGPRKVVFGTAGGRACFSAVYWLSSRWRAHSCPVAGLPSRWRCDDCVSTRPRGYLATGRMRQPRGTLLLCACSQPAIHVPPLLWLHARAAFPHSGGNAWAARQGFPLLINYV